MLSKIWSLIKSLFDVVITIGEFLFSIVEDLIEVIGLVGEAFASVPRYLGIFFPAAFISAIVVILGVVVLYKVLGREG